MTRTLLAMLVLLVTTAALAATPDRDWVRSAIGTFPLFKEDADDEAKRAELDAIAAAVAKTSAKAPVGPREWAALQLAIGFHETGFSRRIIEGRCKPHECDGGRARGLGQVHANALNRADWHAAPGDVDAQVRLLDANLRRAYFTCRRSGRAFPVGALNAYAGRRCDASWPGLEKRVATYERLVRR